MKKRSILRHDHVSDWDGLVTAPNRTQLITPEQMQWNARRNLAMMDELAEDRFCEGQSRNHARLDLVGEG